MQDPRGPLSLAITNPKLRKKKMSTQQASLLQLNDVSEVRQLPLRAALKASKRNFKKEVSTLLHQTERSNTDSLPESTPGNEYRALRRKYLLLEEASSSLDRQLRDVEDEVQTLEDEKLALLDQLVVLEGLIDPLEMQSLAPGPGLR